VVATAAYLGINWLRQDVLGLPAGLWTIGLVQAAGLAIGHLRTRSSNSPANTDRKPEVASSTVPGRIAAAAWESVRVAAGSFRVPQDWFRELENKASTRADKFLTRSRALRIGLDAGPDFRKAITTQTSELEIEWMVLSPGSDDQATLRRHRLDALVRAACGGSSRAVRIVSLEHPERDGAWYDWATPRPLTYASVFPVRVDPTQVTLDDADVADPRQAGLVGGLIRAGAVLSRSPGRIRLSDRFQGRLPSTGGVQGVRTPTSPLDRAMLELTALVVESGATGTPAAKAAARATSAWLASTEAWLDTNLRRQGIEAAAALLKDEPEMMLRVAAVRLAMFEDDAAFEALKEAERLIRAGSHQQIGEHLAFLQAELELGSPNPLTLGRLAAGICLVCASSPPDRVAFIRGDIMDDVRHSAWLVGRDQDRALLGEVFKLMGADQVAPGPWQLRDAA